VSDLIQRLRELCVPDCRCAGCVIKSQAADELERAESDREQLRAATIEECRLACWNVEQERLCALPGMGNTISHAWGAKLCQDAIRALSEPQAKEGKHDA
jgi:hypothetical protein